MTPLTVTFILLGVLMLAAALWLFASAGGEEQAKALQKRVRSGMEHDKVAEGSLVQHSRAPLIGPLVRLFWRAGMEASPLAILIIIVAYVVVALIVLLSGNYLFASLVVIAPPLGLYLYLSSRAANRRLKVVEQLPLFLENALRVLGAGNTMEEAFAAATAEAPEPIKPLFQSIGRQVRLGAPIEQVLTEAGTLYQLRDLKVVALAATVNRRYGGSMRNVLRNLIVAIRQRGTAAKELKALTAETRFSAWVLFLIATGLIIYIYLSNRHYYDPMLATTTGTMVLILTFVFLFVGGVLLYRMVNSIRLDQ